MSGFAPKDNSGIPAQLATSPKTGRKRKTGPDPRGSYRWKRLREEVREAAGHTCERAGCFMAAREVHHKIPLHLGGAPFDRANLILLCDACHAAEHRNDRLDNVPGRAEALAMVAGRVNHLHERETDD